jgi:hypothetical protein
MPDTGGKKIINKFQHSGFWSIYFTLNKILVHQFQNMSLYSTPIIHTVVILVSNLNLTQNGDF